MNPTHSYETRQKCRVNKTSTMNNVFYKVLRAYNNLPEYIKKNLKILDAFKGGYTLSRCAACAH